MADGVMQPDGFGQLPIAHHIENGRERLFQDRARLPWHLDKRGAHIERFGGKAFRHARAACHDAARRRCRFKRLPHC